MTLHCCDFGRRYSQQIELVLVAPGLPAYPVQKPSDRVMPTGYTLHVESAN